MSKEKVNLLLGLSKEAEESQLKRVLGIAQENLERTERFVENLMDDLKDIQDNYEVSDKETLVLWNTAQAQLVETKKDLLRFQRARKKPYFGRIDLLDPSVLKPESYYIGRVGISENVSTPVVIDWRAPIASVYYESTTGKCSYEVRNEGRHEIELQRKRTYEIANDTLKDYFDSDVVANDELLTKYLAKSKKAVLGEIIATIQQEQNAIIRKSPKTNLIVQGVAGSGKTTVAMHRISYILYNYEDEFRPEDFYIVGSNRILLNYITGVLPDLDVYGVSQMTMEQLFVRLLYEDWDTHKYSIRKLDKKDEVSCVKGSYEWFHDLEDFCEEYENRYIPKDDVYMEKTKTLLAGKKLIDYYLKHNPTMSMQSKINMLNEILVAAAENEFQGKNVSFPAKEKEALLKKYGCHFGKDVYKESIFELYQAFIHSQNQKGKTVVVDEKNFDVYDLAALAFLYKRIKETDGIREASHVVIDEAQDFGMMVYGALHYCLRGCTYTIMGDVSQNIHYQYGLNDWEELKSLMLTGIYDSFELLRKSYRNTVEISDFATNILRHGSFRVYPVEPMIRHGSEVCVKKCAGETLLKETITQIKNWQNLGHETIAVICRDNEVAEMVGNQLKKEIAINDTNLETTEFGSGVMVLSVEYTKGLEFDAVILFDPSKEDYPLEDGMVKLLYVACTRALHELCVLHKGDLTDLIATAVDEAKRMESLNIETGTKVKRYENKSLTIRQQQRLDAVHAEEDHARRGYIGPKRIRTDDLVKKSDESQELLKQMINIKRKDASRTTVSKQTTNKKQESDSIPSKEQAGRSENKSPFRFFEMPDTSKLTPKGHSRNDHTIRWMNKTKEYVELTSGYGVLRITPIDDKTIRVQFRRGQIGEFEPGVLTKERDSKLQWSGKDERQAVVIETSAVKVQIEKKTGAVSFYTKEGKLLLKEKSSEPRQVETGNHPVTYTYFEWEKKEKLFAKGIGKDDLRPINGKANYISFGGKELRTPTLISQNGYRLEFAADSTVMCCAIPAYGNYIMTEDMQQIDFYFNIEA